MAYRIDKSEGDRPAIVIDGFEKGIAPSPYLGIGNIRNLCTTYYPGVAYINYRRRAANTSGNSWFAGTHSTDVSGNLGWLFEAPVVTLMTNPLHKAISPSGIIYILDDSGQIWKQTSVGSTSFNELEGGSGRLGNGHGGLAYWNNYLVVLGDGMIEFCGDGTGDAGIISSNWNKTSTSSTVQVAPSAIASTNLPGSMAWTGTVLSGATSATLSSAWQGTSGAYFVRFDNAGFDTRTVTFTSGATTATWSGGIGSNATTDFFFYQWEATAGTFTGYNQFLSTYPVTFSSSATLPTGITAGTTYYLLSGVNLLGTSPFEVSTSVGGPFLPLSDAGTGTITMTLLASATPPIQNTTTTLTWNTLGTGSTSVALPSAWLQSSGNYNIVDPLGNNLLAVFTYLSTTVTLVSPAIVQPSGTFTVQILDTTAPTYKAWVSKVDGNLYFANGRNVGRLISQNTNISFNPGIPASFAVDYAVTVLLQQTDKVVGMTDLKSTLVIAGNFDTYTWDYVSPNVSAPSPVGEQIVQIINDLSNLYILAGVKGNIYLSNGYSNQLLLKIPDYIAGVFDPIWSFGDMMVHRARIFFQAMAQTNAGANILAGIFSVNVSPSSTPGAEMTHALVMEAQNSYGLTPTTGAKTTGVLVDYSPFSTGADSYYSAWSNGTSTGGIDYNDTSLWQGGEAVIETDLVPIGTFLQKQSLGNIEFKTDRPLATGDSIALYWRPTLSDSYTLIGTTTTAVISDYKQSDISTAQWAQFKTVQSGASSGSSFVPLREIRIHYT